MIKDSTYKPKISAYMWLDFILHCVVVIFYFRLEVRVYGLGLIDVENTSTVLVVYQNMLPDVRAIRRALRSGWSGGEATEKPRSKDKRHRRGVRTSAPVSDGYCHLYKWMVDFTALNWTWIIAPQKFEAGYCAGRCPSHFGDLERVNMTNHAFVRMVHRAWRMNVDDGRLPAPACVSIRYSPLRILYRTDENTYKLHTVNEIISNACGCL